jgi:hypothetical protein
VAFFWLLFDAAGGETGRSDDLGDRAAAEEWLGERWADLGETGVRTVALYDGATEVYRMSLDEA